MNALVKLLQVSRPVSWLNTAYPFAAGYLIFQQSINPVFIVGTMFFLIPYNLVMYGVNDVFDYESDIRNPRKGSMEGALAAKQFHKTILIGAGVSSIPLITWLVIVSDNNSRLVLLTVLFFVLAYSVPVLRFKERPFIDSFTSSMHFVGPLIYALALSSFPSLAWPYVIAFFLWGMASHAFGAVQDIVPDRSGKIASIATVLGAKKTVRLATLLYVLASALVIWQGGLAIAVGLSGLLYVVNTVPYLSVSDRNSDQANAGWRRFIYLNFLTGFVITITLIIQYMYA